MDQFVPHSYTHPVFVGDVQIGGGAPIALQSMTSTDTHDIDKTLQQIRALSLAGAKLVRVALPEVSALSAFSEICQKSPIPVIADIHFNHKLAIAAAEQGASAVRINPGNIGSLEKVNAVIEAAQSAHIPIRIGVNEGSLAPKIENDERLSRTDKLIASARSFVEYFESRGFKEVVVSAKTHDVLSTVEVNRRLSRELPHVPLHLGVTEAGTILSGTVKNVAALSPLLQEGIGDTLRISLTADPLEEVRVGSMLLRSLGFKKGAVEIVSCPTCGRTKIDLMKYAQAIENALSRSSKNITVAIMGCVVNGPGEAKHADIGIAGGDGCAALFEKGEIIKTIPEGDIVSELLRVIERDF